MPGSPELDLTDGTLIQLSPLEPASSIIRSSNIFTSHICYYFECSLVAVFASMYLLRERRDECEQ